MDSVGFEVDKVSTLNLPGIAVSEYEVKWDSVVGSSPVKGSD